MASLHHYTRPLPYQPVPTYRDSNADVAIKLDLNALYIKRPKETFFIKVNNPNLLAWGIEHNDLLIIEKEQSQFMPDDMVVIEHCHSYKFYQFIGEVPNQFGKKEKILMAMDNRDKNLTLTDWNEVEVAGVITNVVHQMRNRILPQFQNMQQYAA